jgi:alkyldihydroxyacetonephosphate synthase
MRKLEKLLVTRIRGFEPERMVACTLVYEGSRSEVEAQDRAVRKLARRHGGMRAGAENGRRGYQLTFGIAYLRDFVMRHWILGESFETSVSWSGVLTLCENVKRRLAAECAARGVPGRPFVTARVTQVYHTGVCVYFYFGFYHKGLPHPVETFAELERAARDEILRSGGSLSHHHGVGKLRRGFLPRILSPAALAACSELKRAVDPGNLFGVANQMLGADPAGRPVD